MVIWALDAPERLRADTRAAIEASSNAVLVSPVSPWEIAIKGARGRLSVPRNLLEKLRAANFEVLPIGWEHGLAAGSLPALHRDPFDRMLVAQAQLDGLTVVTSDAQVARYDVSVMPG